jgi:hypothetical protein
MKLNVTLTWTTDVSKLVGEKNKHMLHIFLFCFSPRKGKFCKSVYLGNIECQIGLFTYLHDKNLEGFRI